jgi:hypothetical protein
MKFWAFNLFLIRILKHFYFIRIIYGFYKYTPKIQIIYGFYKYTPKIRIIYGFYKHTPNLGLLRADIKEKAIEPKFPQPYVKNNEFIINSNMFGENNKKPRTSSNKTNQKDALGKNSYFFILWEPTQI